VDGSSPPANSEVQDVTRSPRESGWWDPVLDRNVARSIAEPFPGRPGGPEAVGAESVVEDDSSHPEIRSQGVDFSPMRACDNIRNSSVAKSWQFSPAAPAH
jgi:hypothetical protein